MAIWNIGAKRKWKKDFTAGKEAFAEENFDQAAFFLQTALETAASIDEQDSSYGDTALLLSQVHRRLENYDKSTELAGKAFQYYFGVFKGEDARTIQAHLALVLADASQCHDDGNLRMATYVEADKQFGKSWQLVRTGALALQYFDGTDREKVLRDVQDACTYALGDGRHAELGKWPPVAEEFANQLAIMGHTELAARFLNIQLQIHEEKLGERSDEAANTRYALGLMALEAGDYAKAEVALTRAVEQMKLKAGPKSQEAVQATVALGQALVRQRKLTEAAPFLKEALNKLSLEQIPQRLEALVSLLEFKCLTAGSDAERGSLWRELEGLWERVEDDQYREEIYRGLMVAQERLQQAWELPAADRFLQAVLARVRKWRGPHHPDVAAVMMELAMVALSLDDDKKARTYAEQSVSLDEGVDNQIRAISFYAALGERAKASQYAKMTLRLLRTYSAGVELGRRVGLYSAALLEAGDTAMAINQAEAAIEQLMEVDTYPVRVTIAKAHVYEGRFAEAETILVEVAGKITEPYLRAQAYLYLSWIQCRTGRFTEMQDSVAQVHGLAAIREEHPLLVQAQAVASQGAFYSGNVFQGKEERAAVFKYLSDGNHRSSRRSLGVLTLLDPFGPDECQVELEVGTQILASTNFPEGETAIFPTKDAAVVGLRHLARALYFSEQKDVAKERLNQLEHRFFAHHDKANPLASGVHLCKASLAEDRATKIEALEAARPGLVALGPKQVSLFPTLTLLAETYLEAGDLGKARGVIAEALKMRKSRRLLDWMAAVEKGQNPVGVVEEEAPAAPKADTVSAVDTESPSTGELAAKLEEVYNDPPETEVEEISPPPMTEPEPESEVTPAPITVEEETPVAVEPTPADPEPVTEAPEPAQPQESLVASGGTADLSELSLAKILMESPDAPTSEQVDEFLAEVTARYGEEVGPKREGRALLALLYPDSSDEAQDLWRRALDTVPSEDFEALSSLEQRAKDGNAPELVLQTLERRLNDEGARYGENATESIETLNRMAKMLEAQGQSEEAYHRVVLTTEILSSWFGAKSRRLLAPLADLVRLAEQQGDTECALEHQVERHQLLEATDAAPDELFSSTVSLLPIRARRGQIDELLTGAEAGEKEVASLGDKAAAEFGRALLGSALVVDQLHWRSDTAAKLLEMALAATPDSEPALRCRLDIAAAECQARRDYRAQGARQRKEALERAAELDGEDWAEMLHLAAESCLRVHELDEARGIAEMILEKRLAQGGRKDPWAGRALLILAEADLRSYKLEGTETAIAMSRPSLEGSRYWPHAQRLQCEAMFFLGKEEEAYALLDSLPEAEGLAIQLPLAVWRGRADDLCSELEAANDTVLKSRWKNLDELPLAQAVVILEFLARAGKAKLLKEGLTRLEGRLASLVPTDSRTARVQVLESTLDVWSGRWSKAESTLQRTVDLIPEGQIELPEGLSSLRVRGFLVESLLAQNNTKAASSQAKLGNAASGELLGEEDIRAISFRSFSAYCSLARGEEEEALVLLDEILVPLQDTLGETHVILRDIYRGLSKAFLKQDDIESARLTAEEALRIDRECRGLSFHLVQDLHLLSVVERREDLGEAQNLLDTARELAEQVLGVDHSYTAKLKDEKVEGGEAEGEVSDTDEAVAEIAEEAEPSEETSAVTSMLSLLPTEEPVSPEPEQPEESVEASIDGWSVVEDAEESVEVEQSSEDIPDSAEQLFASEELREIRADEESEVPGFEAIEEPSMESFVPAVEMEVESEPESDEDDVDSDWVEVAEEAPEADEEVAEEASEELAEEADEEVTEEAGEELAEEAGEEVAEVAGEEVAEEAGEEVAEEAGEEVAEEAGEEVAEEAGEEVAEEAGEEVAEDVGEEVAEDVAEEVAEDVAEQVAEMADQEVTEEPGEGIDGLFGEAEDLAVVEEEEAAEAPDDEVDDPFDAETEVVEESSHEGVPRPYKLSALSVSGPKTGSASIEERLDFQQVPFRVPELEDFVEAEQEVEPVALLSVEDESTEDATESAEDATDETESAEDATESAEDATESAEDETESAEDETESAEDATESAEDETESADEATESAEDETESAEEAADTESAEVTARSVSQEMANISDPEAFLLPLAPVFFLPIPWKEATEAAFEKTYEELYERFQEAFTDSGPWRDVVEEAVSVARLEPCPAAGYFLFLVGAQLEKGSRLHTADLCLATAIELLESGAAFGAACHLAGRVAGRRGELRRALDYFERSAELAEEAELAVLKVDAAECHLGLGRPEEALIAFEEVFDYLSENVPTVQALAVQAKMAQIHLLIGDPDSSQSLAEDTKERISPKNAGTYRVLGRILLSRAFARLGRHELALELAEQAWDGARRWSTKRREGRRIAISNMVDIYCLVGKFEEADEILRESGLVGWGLAESELLLRAGHVACALGRHVAARRYLRVGKSFLTRFRSPALWRASFLELEAELSLQLGDAVRAQHTSAEALMLFEREATGPVDRSRHLFRAARIYGALEDFEKANKLVEEAHSLRDLHLGANHPHTESVEGLSAILRPDS